MTYLTRSDKIGAMWKEFKSKTKTSGYLSVECCTQCDFWAPPWLNTKISPPPTCALCPECGGAIEQRIGQYQYTDRETKWFGLVTTKEKVYLNFIRKDRPPEWGIDFEVPALLDYQSVLPAESEEDEAIVAKVINDKNGENKTSKLVPEVDKVGVHRTHCCVVHGCKYGDKDCPVAMGELLQDYICEACDEVEGWNDLSQVVRHVRRNQSEMLPCISLENFNKLYSVSEGHPYEAAAIMQDRIDSELDALAEEQGKAGKAFRKYQLLTNTATTMDKLHLIEDCKDIYDIHYAFAGIGIVFYYSEKDNGDYRSGLAVEAYYNTFEECINAEVKIVIDDMIKLEPAQ